MIRYEEAYESDESNNSSFTNSEPRNTTGEQARVKDGDLGDFVDPNLSLACQTLKKTEQPTVPSRPATSRKTENERKDSDEDCFQCKGTTEPYCHVNLNSLIKLKESTKKLLSVLEEIQSKTRGKNIKIDDANFNNLLKTNPPTKNPGSVTDLLNANDLKKLEQQTKVLDSIYIQDDDDDCSVYKRLTRKCYCLNHHEYNDFVIHFNEDTKYRTSVAGEVIKNMRILKKFLYMNGEYTKNALLFLNEGLAEGAHTEKVEIIQGCAHADICNVFDNDHSIVVMYIAWPCKYEHYGDTVTQALTATFLYKLTQLEEGRRYLNYSSKMTNDLKKVIRKKSTVLEFETLEILNATLNLLNPPLMQNMNITYYYKPVDEGVVKKTLFALSDYRQYMTLSEVFAHLELLYDLSTKETGKFELTSNLPLLLILFKRLLVEYDNSEMNIVLTKILSNIVTKKATKENEESKALVLADIETEPIRMKSEIIQYPPRKIHVRKLNKSKLGLGVAPTKFHSNPTKQKDGHVTGTSRVDPSGPVNRSRKFNNDKHRNSVIIVPIQKERKND